MAELTLLERWDESHTETMQWAPDEIRRALAIAQAVEEYIPQSGDAIHWIMRRADELLEGKWPPTLMLVAAIDAEAPDA